MKKTRANKLAILAFVLGFVAWGLFLHSLQEPWQLQPRFLLQPIQIMMTVPTWYVIPPEISMSFMREGGTVYYIVKSSGAWSSEETVASGSSPAIAVGCGRCSARGLHCRRRRSEVHESIRRGMDGNPGDCFRYGSQLC